MLQILKRLPLKVQRYVKKNKKTMVSNRQNNGFISKEPRGCLVHLTQKDKSSSKSKLRQKLQINAMIFGQEQAVEQS